MTDIFQSTTRPKPDLFFKKNDQNDVRLGEIVSFETEDYAQAEIIILGCPQDEGVRRNGGRTGAAFAPDAIRKQFYKLTNFGIEAKIFDLGDTMIQKTLEQTHQIHSNVVRQILKDEKKIIVLGGGNDISYADGRAMADIFGIESWLAFNVDAHFDVRADVQSNSGTPYRQLLEQNLLKPQNFCEYAWQQAVNSPIYYAYLKNLGVSLRCLTEIREADFEIENLYNLILAQQKTACFVFWGFDVDSVRAADAPGVSAPSPAGLSAEEFIKLANFAGRCRQTRLIEFTELNPQYDIDNRTAKLIAHAMHEFCCSDKQKS